VIHVFLGPTLPVAEARAILGAAEYHPPIRAGDLSALILGLFQQTPSVWHKEILFALSRGVPVYGSSSMGALRAAEMADFGMIGVGEVFRAYRSGECNDDDEVAIVHATAEHGFVPLSDPMVNLRHGLSLAAERGTISPGMRDRLTALAKSWFYPDRSWRRLFEHDPSGRLREFVEREKPDLKRADAVKLLGMLRLGIEPVRTEIDFEPTKYWRALVESSVHDHPRLATHLRVKGLAVDGAALKRAGLFVETLCELFPLPPPEWPSEEQRRDTLLAWYASRTGIEADSAAALAERLGVPAVGDLLDELEQQWLRSGARSIASPAGW
jgi:hypothetical protein